MKSFYIMALCIAGVLVISPLIFLSDVFTAPERQGSAIRNVYSAAVKSIDPATAGDTSSAAIQANMYESLYTYHFLKRPLEVVAQLAAAMPRVSDDGLTVTIPIKAGVTYHRNPCFGPGDVSGHRYGTREVQAADFVLAFKRIADYHINTGLAWAFLANRVRGLDAYREITKKYNVGDYSRYDLPVEGVRAIDPHTFQIVLTKPFPQLIYVLAMNVYAPIPREAVDYWLTQAFDDQGRARTTPLHERNPEFREQAHVVGTGPYILDTWKRKWKIVLVRNPEYRNDYYPGEGQPLSPGDEGDRARGLLDDAGRRVPFIDRIDFDFIEEPYAAWMLFLSGQTDIAAIPRENFESVVTPDKHLARQWREKQIHLISYTDPSIYWIVFNMEDKVFSASKSLRQAICLGYDVESEIEVMLNGRGKRAVNCVPSAFKGHAAAGPGHYYRYDPAAARQKLAQAKVELRQAGLLVNGDIPPLKLDLSQGTYATRMADFIRQQFTPLGLEIKIIFNDWPTLQRKVHNKQAQMYMMGWHADYPDAENFLQLFYSRNIDKGTNNANYRNPEFDALYETIRTMPDSPERTGIYSRMIRMISEDCPVLLLYEPENFILYHDWVKNVKPHPVGYGYMKYRRIDEALKTRLSGGD
ncbi:MAG: hypothetical protein HKP58_15315 [Desulfatitalea sp.]|nr:hypothetical protein [Desulfatitalea sp.]NNK01779.1 hypothetical protein [Desulfatitalea sp.]